VAIAVEADGGSARVRQEFAGGRSQQLEVRLPAIVGVQAARQPPRYAPISRIRQVMQAGGLLEAAAPAGSPEPALAVRRMYAPEQAGHAEMLAGSTGSVADQIIELLRSRGLVKG
jgi:electron transfer flavoprotein beta subunit